MTYVVEVSRISQEAFLFKCNFVLIASFILGCDVLKSRVTLLKLSIEYICDPLSILAIFTL